MLVNFSQYPAPPILECRPNMPFAHYQSEWTHMFYISLILMLPVSLLSGILFTLIGEGVYLDVGESLETTGLLIMVNTMGAAIGSLLAGFVVLPAAPRAASLVWAKETRSGGRSGCA